jgi:hypothetical protein
MCLQFIYVFCLLKSLADVVVLRTAFKTHLLGQICDASRISATRSSAPKRCFDHCSRKVFLSSPTVNLFGAEMRVAEIRPASKI